MGGVKKKGGHGCGGRWVYSVKKGVGGVKKKGGYGCGGRWGCGVWWWRMTRMSLYLLCPAVGTMKTKGFAKIPIYTG